MIKKLSTNTPLISVIIPSYNRAKLIKKAVDSVLNQTYQNLELILVDDCSSDNTKDVITEIKDERIKYFCLDKNSGACVARNLGIEKASGEYIAFNDSDDMWKPEKLERQLDFLLTYKGDVTCCSMDVFDENSSKKMYQFPDSKKCPEGKIEFKQLLSYNSTSTQMLFGKAECFKIEKFDNMMPRFQDWEECLRLSSRFYFIHQNEVLVNTYQQKDSITKNPQKGLSGMKILFEKNKESILSDSNITENFMKKMASFSCRCNKNPIMEMKFISEKKPSLKNYLKLFLARTGLYRILFKLKNM